MSLLKAVHYSFKNVIFLYSTSYIVGILIVSVSLNCLKEHFHLYIAEFILETENRRLDSLILLWQNEKVKQKTHSS